MNKVTGILLAVLLAAVIIAAAAFILYIMPLKRYNSAKALLQSRHYEDAIAAFQQMKGYRDSETKIQEAYYRMGRTMMAEGNYSGAEEAFLSAGEFQDSPTQVLESRYRRAGAYLEQGDYVAAAEAFDALGSYSDSAAQRSLSVYLHGKTLMDMSSFADAAAVFASLGDYQDSRNLQSQCWYLEGQRLMERGSLEQAADAFVSAGSYSNSAELLAQVRAQLSQPSENNDFTIPMPIVTDNPQTPAAPSQPETVPAAAPAAPQTAPGTSARFSAVIAVNNDKNSNQTNLSAIAADRAASGSYSNVWFHIRVNSTVANRVNLRYTIHYADGTSRSDTWTGGISTNAFYYFRNAPSRVAPSGIDLYDGDTGELIGSMSFTL